MAKFYFTYGTEGQPFVGGWSVVYAETFDLACKTFRIAHPDRIEGLLNCAGVYNESAFNKTKMAKQGNFGKFCHEKIIMNVEEVLTHV